MLQDNNKKVLSAPDDAVWLTCMLGGCQFLVKGRYGRIFISGKGKIWKDIYFW